MSNRFFGLLTFLLIALFSCVDLRAASLTPGSLLFSGQRNGVWDLYLWSPDPTPEGRLTPLTATPNPEGNPVYWPAKRLILCSSPGPSGLYEICAIDLSGREVRRIGLDAFNLGWPQPSPDDHTLVAVREDPRTGRSDPCLIDWSSGACTLLSAHPLPGGQPTWLSNSQLLLSRVTPTGFDLCLHDIDSGTETVLVSGGQNWLPATLGSPDTSILFTRRVGQTGSIFRLWRTDDGWEYDNLSQARQYDWMPSLTPAGEGAIFLSLRNGRFVVVYKSLADLSEFVIPVRGFQHIYHPTWIPVSVSSSTPAYSTDGEPSR